MSARIKFFARGKEMKRWIVVAVVILVAGLLISIPAALSYWQRPDMVHACSGTVVDSTGRPVANARVGILTCGGETAVSYSNRRGGWRIRGLLKNSAALEHVSGYFVTHPDYVGIHWPVSHKIQKVVLVTPVSLKIRFKELSNLQNIYAELDEDYKAKLATHYGVETISPYPYTNRKQVDDDFELGPLISAPYKVTVGFHGKKPPVVKYIDTREKTELWF